MKIVDPFLALPCSNGEVGEVAQMGTSAEYQSGRQ